MFFQAVDLTTALRPSLLPDETLLFVQDAVGLYEGYAMPTFYLHDRPATRLTWVESTRFQTTSVAMPT